MKKFILIFLLVNAKLNNAQTYVLIPDANFVAYLQALIPSAMNGNSLNITSTLVTTATQTVTVNSLSISNLSGIQYFSSLASLDCGSNSLSNLPVLPNSLQVLFCDYNLLSNLSALPNSLSNLHCEWNQLTSLPALPNSLINLNCWHNQLSNLPALPNSLISLNCDANSLTALPVLNNSLQTLNCDINSLTYLPPLPNSITFLSCGNNSLTTLPALPNTLQGLSCYNNSLTTLPALPNSLQTLNCYGNSFNTLPVLPNSLQYLNCNSNSLTALPALPNSLDQLVCANNNIVCFPVFPNSLTFCNINNNPFNCLPNIVLPAMSNYTSVNIPCVANSGFTLVYSGTPQIWLASPNYSANVTNAIWSWGDGNFANTMFTSHTYSAAGFYNICLSVTVSCANTSTSSTCSGYNIYKTNGSVNTDMAMVTINVVNSLPVGTGIKKMDTENELFSLYPNPTNSTIFIQNTFQKNGSIKVFNFEGKEFQNLILENNKETKIENLNAGIYFIEVKIESSVSRKKVVILK